MKQNGKLLSILGQDRLFSVLDSERLTALTKDPRCSVISYPSGKPLYADGSFRQALGMILCGTVDVYRLGGGTRVLLQQLHEGGLFGATTLFSDEERYVTTLVAKTSTEVFFLPAEVCQELITSYPAFALGYIHFLSDRIRFLNRRLAALAAPAVEQKVAQYLLREDRPAVVNRVQLASALGIGRASLYRVLDDLEARGLILKDGKQIIVADSDRLSRLL